MALAFFSVFLAIKNTDIENRTRKGLLPADFESTASTSSAMSALTAR